MVGIGEWSVAVEGPASLPDEAADRLREIVLASLGQLAAGLERELTQDFDVAIRVTVDT